MFVNKEMGTVQYIGQTDFAPGVWLGVSLRNQVNEAYYICTLCIMCMYSLNKCILLILMFLYCY